MYIDDGGDIAVIFSAGAILCPMDQERVAGCTLKDTPSSEKVQQGETPSSVSEQAADTAEVRTTFPTERAGRKTHAGPLFVNPNRSHHLHHRNHNVASGKSKSDATVKHRRQRESVSEVDGTNNCKRLPSKSRTKTRRGSSCILSHSEACNSVSPAPEEPLLSQPTSDSIARDVHASTSSPCSQVRPLPSSDGPGIRGRPGSWSGRQRKRRSSQVTYNVNIHNSGNSTNTSATNCHNNSSTTDNSTGHHFYQSTGNDYSSGPEIGTPGILMDQPHRRLLYTYNHHLWLSEMWFWVPYYVYDTGVSWFCGWLPHHFSSY
ncbi:hypothetical protein HGRIS_006003 [Hohenbuehelia grisea]